MTTSRLDVQRLFPPEEIARRTDVLDRFWAGQAVGEPVIVPMAGEHSHNNFTDADLAFQKFAAALEYQSRIASSYIPSFQCVLGTCALPSAFGGAVSQEGPGKPFWIEPVVHQAGDVARLKAPKVQAGLVGRSIEVYQQVLDRLDGYVPPRVPDMQGPLNVASMIWQQERFLMAMYDEPQAVHDLLELVTDYIIEVLHHFRRNFPQAQMINWPFIYMPQSLGAGITEDLMHLLSAELYEEFGLPYVNRIAREFDGLYIHCCGVFKHHWPTLRKVHNLRGLDTMYDFTDPREILAFFPDIVHTMWLDYAAGVRHFAGDRPRFTQFLLDCVPPQQRFIFMPNYDLDTNARHVELIRQARSGR